MITLAGGIKTASVGAGSPSRIATDCVGGPKSNLAVIDIDAGEERPAPFAKERFVIGSQHGQLLRHRDVAIFAVSQDATAQESVAQYTAHPTGRSFNCAKPEATGSEARSGSRISLAKKPHCCNASLYPSQRICE